MPNSQSSLSAAYVAVPERHPSAVPQDALGNARITILDDDEDNVVLLTRLLQRSGYAHVQGETDPEAALEKLLDEPPDLLLLDLHMAPVDGWAVLDRLSGRAGGPAVLVLTADTTRDALHRSLSAGARDVLTKPYDLVEVLLRVGNLLELRYLHDRLATQAALLDVQDQGRLEQLARLAGDLAHELRTPLYAIRGLVEVVLQEDEVGPGPHRDLEVIDEVALDALTVVDRQIDMARTATGRVQMVPELVRVEQLLDALWRSLEPIARSQRIRFVVGEADGVPTMRTDGVLLAQVLRNLISNAIRHTYVGEVRVAVSSEPDGQVAFAVSDTGVGIHPDDHERVFRPFEQADGDARRPGGLGLPLARRLARRLGGDVELTSRLGSGSTFTVRVPAEMAPPGATG